MIALIRKLLASENATTVVEFSMVALMIATAGGFALGFTLPR